MVAPKEQDMKWVDMNLTQKVVHCLKVFVMVISLGFIFPKVL